MNDSTFRQLDLILSYAKPILIALSVFWILGYLLKRNSLKNPIGNGFKNIRLPLMKGESLVKVFSFDYLVRGVLVIGSAGSGKSKSLLEPLVRQTISDGYTGIVYDFKFPSVSNLVYKESLLRPSNNVKLFYVNFVDFRLTNRFNVFGAKISSSFAQEYASSLMMNLNPETVRNQNFFTTTATALLSAAILYFNKKQTRLCTLPHIISFLLNEDIQQIVNIVSQDPEASDLVAPVRSGLSSEKQTAGVISTLQNSLNKLTTPNIFWVLSGNDFDLDLNNLNHPKLLIIGNDAPLIDSLSPLVALIVTVAAKQMNQINKARSILLLDEGATLYIPHFDTIPATGRENKIATAYFAQDISQMEERYGEKKAEVLISNLSNQFYGKISNPKTCEKVIKIFGNDEVEFESKSNTSSNNFGASSSSGSNRSLQQRNKISIQQLRDLNPGEFVASSVRFKDFKARFKELPIETFPLPTINFVEQEQIERNYAKIKMEIRELFETIG